tara:strand:- start:605 stop:1126 length:522 start_codon:yes stop_codon:yes gene_type:complete
MGKTEKGAVWLDNKLLSSYDYWQFWRNTDDRDVQKFIKMFTDLDLNKIDKIKNKDINQLKIILANEATAMLHGKFEAEKAEKTAKKTFEENLSGEALPSIKVKENINIVDVVITSKLENSKSEIRRLIKGNGIKINNVAVENDRIEIKKNLLNDQGFFKLSIGKKKHIKVIID